jgi:hypothetical protein
VELDVRISDPSIGDGLIRNVDLDVSSWVKEDLVHNVLISGVVVTDEVLCLCNGFSSSHNQVVHGKKLAFAKWHTCS